MNLKAFAEGEEKEQSVKSEEEMDEEQQQAYVK
jgi:hypothetical protein